MSQRILITGISGFVGYHLLSHYRANKAPVEILGVDLFHPKFELNANSEFKQIDLLDEEKVNNLIRDYRPDFVIHLASFSKVSDSWVSPIESFKNNTNIFLNLIEAIRKNCPTSKLLSIGSSEEYGIVDAKKVPLNENDELNPNSPYSVARASQEWMSKVYAKGFGIDVIITRSFNHYGTFQNDNFVLPSMVKQLCEIKKGNGSKLLSVGNIDIVRDFIHVKDVVQAYTHLLEKGKSGEVYNICTGRGISLRDVIQIISDKLEIKPEITINKEFYRPNDNPIIIGDNTKLHNLGWIPEISLEEGLDELIAFYLKLK
ncbi:MAG: GDP-mannose 4,6-dehydratase [Crocinitomicaceae bacterium]|nr:GDP-mannose 4,6-dehydratase [Crocinitomicaceae bacterium]